MASLCFRSEVEVDGVVVGVVHCLQTGTVALQLEDGRIRRLLWGPCYSFHFGLLSLSDHVLRKVVVLMWHLRQPLRKRSADLCPDGWLLLVSCVGCPGPSVEGWCDPSGCSVSLPAPCTQTALCSIGGQVKTRRPLSPVKELLDVKNLASAALSKFRALRRIHYI